MKKIVINNIEYELLNDYKSGFDLDTVLARCNDIDYFDKYDYIFGDWSYGKIRLKGFCDKNNDIYNKLNDFNKLDDYIKSYCSYECRYFILKKI